MSEIMNKTYVTKPGFTQELDMQLWANAWRAPPATCARCHIYSKDSRSLYSVSIPS